ncbi:MAG: thioredoxin domain-containing protein [Methylophilaceae bacterium]
MTNRLANETSPYLLQHADNPVEWYPWGEEALKLAREQDKPILLSVGYSACHWCHVMAHESFEDAEVAAVMNRYFINIKVDREERPDIDQIYQTAHSMLSNKSGGWPLTVFLTPQQEPFYSGTYFPKTARYQLPGFPDLVTHIAGFYHQRKEDLAEQNRQLLQAMARTVPTASNVINAGEETIQLAFEHLKSGFDFEHGGFGSAPKFPNPADVNFLLRLAAKGNKEAEAMALQMLHSMAAGGIYDQIGGGFCRYSVDEKWMIPHFEKMLYDNGQLLCLYVDGWQLSKDPRFVEVIEETIDWMVREMRSSSGAFYSSLDADSEGEEGRFYVWQPAEAKALLAPDEFVVASRYFGFDRAPNFEGHDWHAYLTAQADAEDKGLLDSARTKLFQAREQRIRPGRDDKLLTSWNALAIKGLARAGRILNRPEWVILAQQALDFIKDKLWVDEKLLATCKDDIAHLNAYLDDYAFLLDALLELMQAEYRAQDMEFAEDLAETLLEEFESEHGGFYFTGHNHEVLIHRTKQAYDNATPNGNGIAAISLQRLGHMLGESRYLQAVERSLKAFDGVMQRSPSGCPNMLVALDEFLLPPTMLILRGAIEAQDAWRQQINRRYLPAALTFYLSNDLKKLPQTLERPASDAVNAWVCRGVECLPVINELEGLLTHL